MNIVVEINTQKSSRLAKQIVIAMVAGIIVGLLLNALPSYNWITVWIIDGLLHILGQAFISVLTMLVVPIVFVSLVCGTCQLGDLKKFGALAGKTFGLYLITTAIAITLGLTFANLFDIGSGSQLIAGTNFTLQSVPCLKEVLLNIIPKNPFAALAKGDMLQVIVFSILFGSAIAMAGKSGQRVADFFEAANAVVMKLMMMVMLVAPYGVFCLIAGLLAKTGFNAIFQLLGYFLTVMFVLLFHLIFTNSIILKFIGGLNPLPFFKKMYSAMIFGFSTSSSSASIPVTLNVVENKLGVKNSTAAFVIPLGATINMDGTAIMQGVATVFIAHSYNIPIGLTGYLMVILTATLASIGTAGVPGVGLITLTMVLKQVGLPVEGIAMIIGVDRLLDMLRTAVNISGDSAIACIVGKSEKNLNLKRYNQYE